MSRGSLIKLLWGENRALNILILLLLIANLSAYLIQTQVLDKKLSGLHTEVSARQQSLRTLQQQKRAGSMPVSTLTQAENNLAQFYKRIPPEEKLSELVGEVYNYADKTNLGIKQISYTPEWDKELKLLRYDLKFSVSGQYAQLKRFIHLLERAERILIISDITLTRPAGSKADAEVTLQLGMDTFFRDVDR